MADIGTQTRHLWLPDNGDPYAFVKVKVLTALQ